MIDRRQTERMQHARSRLRTGATAILGLLLVAGTLYAAAPVEKRAGREIAATAPDGAAVPSLTELESRVNRLERGWARLAAYYDAEVAPIEEVLLRYGDDRELVSRVATAVVREAHAANLEPRLLLGVLLVENPWLDPSARSFVGAVGLMQVMPVHQGGWSCGWDLEQIDTNVCLGARVFAHYLQRSGGNVEKALLRYNGCVTGSNTPNCHEYPSRVLERAGGSSKLAWSGGGGGSAGSP
ncbi:MAG: transglycosylase SLT domain-containing protein [Candidatus Longimicrobiales bacterium M2_2A_002]